MRDLFEKELTGGRRPHLPLEQDAYPRVRFARMVHAQIGADPVIGPHMHFSKAAVAESAEYLHQMVRILSGHPPLETVLHVAGPARIGIEFHRRSDADEAADGLNRYHER
jgi:hypothetical protein